MLKLKNIKRSDSQIEADYFPEGKFEPGHIVLDIKTEKVISANKSPKDYYDGIDASFYFPHAVALLREASKRDFIPEELMSMWY